jgi:tRNA(fMet)-specific endonuclease VapC
MLKYLLDTDHLTLYEHGHALVVARVWLQPAGTVGISVVTVEEALRGRLAALARAASGPARIHNYALLWETTQLLVRFPNVPYDQAAEDEFQRLRSVRIGTRDRKIVSIALANQLIVVTRNRGHFGLVPGLTIEDWSIRPLSLPGLDLNDLTTLDVVERRLERVEIDQGEGPR